MIFNSDKYHELLSAEMPEFLYKYIELPGMQRLSGIGLLCGTDWTPLFNNKFFYSRLEHSIGVALIIWNFTHSKKQTLAGLFHDIATPAFSHVNDFRNGDALTQESTEDRTCEMICEDQTLIDYLKHDGYYGYEVRDYHKFPIADNDIPRLSADRLEYMYPSGAALDGIWTMEEIAANYSDILVLENEDSKQELGFAHQEQAFIYTKKFLETSIILQHNEDKLAMQLMADVLKRALDMAIIIEWDLYTRSEEELISYFDSISKLPQTDAEFSRLYKTFRSMNSIQHTQEPLADSYCVNLEVKKRYIDPLVKTDSGSMRLSELSKDASQLIKEFLEYRDTPFGCAKYEG